MIAGLFALGCTHPLLVGELVVPGDLPVEAWWGADGAALGTDVAVRADGEVAALAPGEGAVWVGRPGEEALRVDRSELSAAAVWFDAKGRVVVGSPREGVTVWTGDAWEAIGRVDEALVYRGGPFGWAAATPEGVVHSDGRSWAVAGVRTLALDERRVVALACGVTCEAWDLGLDAARVGPAGDGGDVALEDGVAWWGDPELTDAVGAGRAVSETGEQVEGLPGDHLGRRLGGGWVSGSLNEHTVPRRLRLLPLAGGEALAVDRLVAGTPAAMAVGPDGLVVGLAAWPGAAGRAGAVLVVPVP